MDWQQDWSLSELGKLLAESHDSSSLNFENSCSELDYLSQELNRLTEVYGARLTGGGFGGAVMAWTSKIFLRRTLKKLFLLTKKNSMKRLIGINLNLPTVQESKICSNNLVD